MRLPGIDTLSTTAGALRVLGVAAAALLVILGPRILRLGGARRRIALLACIIPPCLAVGASIIFPPDAIPHPSGPFGVGETDLAWDALPRAPRTADESAERPVPLVHIWYPAAATASRTGPDRWWNALRRGLLGADPNPATPEAPLAAGSSRLPVLLYYPGWPGTRIENFTLIAELASHGFVVAGVAYPARTPGMSRAAYLRQLRDLEEPMDYSSQSAYLRTLQRAQLRVSTRARDALAVLDALARLAAADGPARFARRLDVERVGIIGFSLGGAVAAEASRLDPRICAVVNMDGRHWGDALADGVAKPYLYIGEELVMPNEADLAAADPDRRYNAMLDRFDYSQLAANLRRHGGIQVTVYGALHPNFTDSVLRSPLRRFTGGGAIDAARGLAIVNAYVLAFLGQVLRGEPSTLLIGAAQPFSEARIQVWKP